MIAKSCTNFPPSSYIKLIRFRLTSGDLTTAHHLFEQIPEPDIRTWTLLISAHSQHGFPRESLKLYAAFRSKSRTPDNVVLLSVAKACARLCDVIKARELHGDVIRFGFGNDVLVGNALIDMYAKCNCVDGARLVFGNMVAKDVISWTSMASCYVNSGLPRQGLGIIREMLLYGVRPNSMTMSSILPACSDLKSISLGRDIHGFVMRNGMEGNVFVSSALVDMYANCSCLKQAHLVFENMSERDVVSWNVILSAFFCNKEFEKGLGLFYAMRDKGVKLDHASWNAILAGCLQNGRSELMLEMIGHMQDSGFKPNRITITSILPACTSLENIRVGKQIHGYTFRQLFIEDLPATTGLVLMYAKCGDLELSQRVFNMMPRKDTVAWNTMIMAASMHGKGEEALFLFHKMLNSGDKANSATFVGVLSGCSHSKLVDQGLLIFNSMSSVYSVEPDSAHYSCMVDVLSRAGRLKEAYELIQQMPMESTASAWGALLGACRVYKNVELGKVAAKRLFEIEPENPGNYVLLFNIFVTAKLWEEASVTRKMMRDRGITKKPGCSWIETKNRIYTFVAGDKSNKHMSEICRFLDDMGEKMRLAGFVPNTDFVLQDVDQDEKLDLLCNHSEKLAVAFGIMNLNGASVIRVFKNLRICGDCHNFIKFMAKIFGVHIIVRDCLRFHHFKDGYCSCGDFW